MINKKKFLAMVLIFTLTFSHFAIVTESIATTNFISLFGTDSGTGNKNVEFEAYWGEETEKSEAIASDVNNDNLDIQLQLGVYKSGYLKGAKVEIQAEEEQELNFEIKEENKVAESEYIQSLENNILMFNKVENSSEKMQISIPIEYKMEEYIKEEKLCSTFKVIFSGVYVDEKGKENEVMKEIPLTLAWKDEAEVKVETEISKYIPFGKDGVILQTLIKVNRFQENKKSLPVKQTQLSVDVPKINDILPTEVMVGANSTAGTNGKNVGEVEFSKDNWDYDQEENKINIKLENKKQLVDSKQSETFLKVEDEQTKQEERYFSKAGMDEYFITYTFRNIELAEQLQTTSKVKAKVTTLSGVKADSGIYEATDESEQEVTLTGQTGNLVSYQIENETQELSKVYAYLNQETEINTKTAINISYKEIIEEIILEDTDNYYIDKAGNHVQTEDIYYKQMVISQENFNEILGADGTLQITDVSGNILTTINKDCVADENGNYVVSFQDKISKVILKTSAPINTGNFIITTKKITLNSMSKMDYANMEFLASQTVQKAKFTYVSDLVELGNLETKTKLNDTKTDFNFVLDRESLSTVTPNTNVEMRLELNNDKLTSDIYGASVFELEMPEYITSLKITNASMVYGEGLNIAGVESYIRDGKIVIKIIVDGKQTALNSGVLTNGTNIVLNADIEVDMYTPSKEVAIQAYGYNSEATNYQNPAEYQINNQVCGHQQANIQYSAPNGVVAINTIKNYKDENVQITSIKQGPKIDYIDIYSQAKNAIMEMVVMNNNENAISDFALLGRVPFKGIKDIETGEDLGTTLDTKMLSEITASVEGFTIYYSENGQANKDLADETNGWMTNPQNLENIKSYLIVPNDANRQIEAKQVLKFEFAYQIPENLSHNQKIYGTYLTYYTNHGPMAVISETAKPDLVGLTTGAGPELELEVKSNVKKVKAFDDIKITTTVKNVGEDVANEVLANILVPENTTFVSAEVENDMATATFQDGKVVVKKEQLAKDAQMNITIVLKAKDIYEYESDKIQVTANVMAKNLQKELTKTSEEITIQRSELSLEQKMLTNIPNYYFHKGDQIYIQLYARNLTDSEKRNVSIVTQLPKEFELEKAYMVEGNSIDGIQKIENATYESQTNQVKWNLDKIDAKAGKSFSLILKVGNLDAGLTQKQVSITSQISAEGTEKYNAKEVKVDLGRSSLSITQNSNTPTYVQEGDLIHYTFTIKNEGASIAENVVLTDIIPEGIMIQKISYVQNGEEHVSTVYQTEDTDLILTIPANSQIDVNVQAFASSLDGVQEKTVTNEGKLSIAENETISSNKVTHIIQANEANNKNQDVSNNNGITPSDETRNDITKSYKISGTAWIDSNKNGMRDQNEKRMPNVTAMLVDSSSGVIKSTVSTNASGEYTFTGLKNGSYLVLFKYDTVLYTTTAYRKEGIESNLNSDVVTTKIEQDGKRENGAVTDVIQINGASVSNIDIGLVEAQQFSLSLENAITKVTVQNAQGTKTEEFNKTKLAKYDIAAKYLAGTKVYVEYTLTVTNNGDLAGFATEIVDYLPQGMTFNSNLNPDWYTGTDGNLYTKALANTEIAKGQSKEIKLVLTKQMTAENTGLVSNTAEISDDFNIYGISDHNSKPKNRAQGEDDMSTADIIITVKTGETLIYVSAIIVSVILGGTVAFVLYKKVLKDKRKGGVLSK